MAVKKTSAAEKKRRSKAAEHLYAAACTLQIYGYDEELADRLKAIADEILEK